MEEVNAAINDIPRLLQPTKPVSGAMRDIAWLSTMYCDFDDACQQAAFGIMRAAKKFQPERGLKFLTYAVWYIRAELQIGLRTQHKNSVIRSPRGHTPIYTDYKGGADNSIDVLDFIGTPGDTDTIDGNDTVEFMGKLVCRKDWDMLLSYADGESMPNIGKKYGVTRARVHQYISRARRRITEPDLFAGVVR
jgi:hypothetical protein